MAPLALLHGFALTLDLAVIVVLLVVSGVLIWLEAKKERNLPERGVEAEEREDWSWPARKVGPVGRTHLGAPERFENRRAA